ncbi:N-formylglutamate amidohydrolase [Candidatus Woesearchaeota archaeon]|nr:N-formylglutamate amidohydrolase [Candidatus Woesearchaeota archaeon]
MNVIISIPHSSTYIPESSLHLYKQTPEQLKCHEDYGVDSICALVGYPVVQAPVSRFVVDVNRKRDDFSGDQGVIIKKDWNGEEVLKEIPPQPLIDSLLERFYDPYYEQIFGYVSERTCPFLIDCHAMDSEGNAYSAKDRKRPDICVTTANYQTCNEDMAHIIGDRFKGAGLSVDYDFPYSGQRANIIKYAHSLGAESVELEFNKRLYMNEHTFEMDLRAIRILRGLFHSLVTDLSSEETKSVEPEL